ncbi:MAG: acyl-ACP--UDP-N-acetylglucosamine O-acyltransferase, partial [Prevotella sp.]|nr:acyl-ACP--UDP-N-acetylglucosamine O-acyltransferase [Prevotella sp.]
DIPPYIICTRKAEFGGVNYSVGRQHGVDEKVLKHIANTYRLVFQGKSSLFDTILQIKEQVPDGAEIRNIIEFLETTKMGVISKM